MEAVYSKCSKSAVYNELHRGLQPFVYWHVTESIQEGYNPESIGELQEHAEVEALVLERRSVARDCALGYFVSLLHHYLARQTDLSQPHIDQAIAELSADFEKETPLAPFADFRLDIADIYAYVEEQKQNAGLIADDGDWHHRSGISSNLQWNVVFKNALDLTRTAYTDACQRFEHRFIAEAQADLALIQLVADADLAGLAFQTRAKPRHVPAPPTSLADKKDPHAQYWSNRIGHTVDPASKNLPDFDPEHLISAGRAFRTACIDNIRADSDAAARASQAGKELDVVLSKAINLDTNPIRLLEHARGRWTPQQTTSEPPVDEESTIRAAKEVLNTALRILGQRDGQRNINLRTDCLNLRGHINKRLAALRPQHQANYLGRAVADWFTSSELDSSQSDIIELLAQTEIAIESLNENIAQEANKKPSSADSAVSRDASASGAITANATATADQPDTAPGSGAESVTVRLPPSSKVTGETAAAKNPTPKVESTSSPAKPREKIILDSPFFRSDLVTGLMVDALLALPFPHRAFRETLRFPPAAAIAGASQDHVPMLDRLAKAHQQSTKALTAENRAQLKTAIKAVSAVLALPDVQQMTREDSPEKVLRRTSLRLVLGTLHLLLNEFVKGQTELELVSNALRPNARGGRTGEQKQSSDEAASDARERTISHMQTRVQGQTLFLLAKTCWMTNKVQEAIKFFRWFVRWYSEQQAERVAERKGHDEEEGGRGTRQEGGEASSIDVEELDMGWWDKVVVVTKT
ncbi:hypothetical protein PHSY_000058 [Pseudozyma hubeiensis SY62]|uniref:Uncharacterized protein n=1 Tax=Pseudozyma hubeiensis (strain SY62) TaxID=1305764 RepID=R9NVL6_PSEHS|nr:hypothetical protein PHSY_000058 [Pseudozyma hubeiensis SY62]GAC92504.1 hypothetical protein PHSY_000058 [Pseudozyma hubeiensis SY62]